MSGRLVVAVGGNSLVAASGAEASELFRGIARGVAQLVAGGVVVAITHGNGPQVGALLRRSELARAELPETPLDVCGAETQGSIGYTLQQALGHALAERGITPGVATLVTQVEVDPGDPAFDQPTKPIGEFMSGEQAERRRREDGWRVVEDADRGWRRVVASPAPRRIVEIDALRALLDAGFVVIGAGGGGVPVVPEAGGGLRGVAAVIDKDLTAALLARQIGASRLCVLTAVEQVALRFGAPDQEWVDHLRLADAKRFLGEGTHFAPGSMAPKMQAVVEFLEGGGEEAIVAHPRRMQAALAGRAGTRITP